MSIVITPTREGFSVKIPFDLNAQFKADFPLTRFRGADKSWSVLAVEGRRLRQWAEEHKEAAELAVAAEKRRWRHRPRTAPAPS